MQKKFDFGKIALYGDRKIHNITVDVELDEKNPDKPVFTASADVWNSKHTDSIMGGQCLDTLLIFLKDDDTYKVIYEMWEKYHLNDLKAGTPEQEELVKQWLSDDNEFDYDNVCMYLQSLGKYEVDWEGKKYKYGHRWLYSPIPAEDLARIKLLLQ